MKTRLAAAACLAGAAVLFSAAATPLAQTLKPGEMLRPLAPGGVVTMGLATDLRPGHPTTKCSNANARFPAAGMPASAGTVTLGSQKITVPLTEEGSFAVDLYNDCIGTGDNPDWERQLETVVIDKDGVDITGFIHADNYFELWVNGRFVARDSIGMVPFNTSVVRFRARYPITYAIKAVDWESHPGIGMEYANFNIGDGGFIAYFSDGTRTDATWRAETFYVAPLDDPSCVRATDSGRDSTFCSQSVRPVCAMDPTKACSALHFPVPASWTGARFDDRTWPRAVEWPAALVTDHPSYTRHAQVFQDAEFIWTRNLRLDNLVLARYTATGPRRPQRAAAPAAAAATGESLTWDHIHLGVPDPAAATEWYVRYLDAARRPDGMNGVFFGPTRFNMRVNAKPVASNGSIIDHLALSYADVEAQVKRLAGSGATILEAPRSVAGMGKRAFVQDPWGVKIELVEDRQLLGFHHVHARAPEPGRMLDWFAAHVGGERGRMHGAEGLRYGGIWLVVDRGDAAPADGNAIDHLGFRTKDLKAKLVELRGKGLKATDPRPDPNVATTFASFVDGTPTGRIEVTQR